MTEITQSELKHLLHYNPETGEFHWLRTKWKKVWHKAGTLTKRGYLVIKLKQKQQFCHRLAWLYMTGEWPPEDKVIDHIDRNPSNNKWDNLRVVTNSQNGLNKEVKWGASGYKGVSYHVRHKKWMAAIRGNGVKKHIGYFDTAKEAAIAYNKEVVKIHGEFAQFNLIEDQDFIDSSISSLQKDLKPELVILGRALDLIQRDRIDKNQEPLRFEGVFRIGSIVDNLLQYRLFQEFNEIESLDGVLVL